jgi:hypothetical protein
MIGRSRNGKAGFTAETQRDKSRNQRGKRVFTTETQSTQSSEYF